MDNYALGIKASRGVNYLRSICLVLSASIILPLPLAFSQHQQLMNLWHFLSIFTLSCDYYSPFGLSSIVSQLATRVVYMLALPYKQNLPKLAQFPGGLLFATQILPLLNLLLLFHLKIIKQIWEKKHPSLYLLSKIQDQFRSPQSWHNMSKVQYNVNLASFTSPARSIPW